MYIKYSEVFCARYEPSSALDLSRIVFSVEGLKFRECTSFVPVNAVLMCKALFPSKTVKTSWIRQSPLRNWRRSLPREAALHVTKYKEHSTPFVGFQVLTSCKVLYWAGHSHTKQQQSRPTPQPLETAPKYVLN